MNPLRFLAAIAVHVAYLGIAVATFFRRNLALSFMAGVVVVLVMAVGVER